MTSFSSLPDLGLSTLPKLPNLFPAAKAAALPLLNPPAQGINSDIDASLRRVAGQAQEVLDQRTPPTQGQLDRRAKPRLDPNDPATYEAIRPAIKAVSETSRSWGEVFGGLQKILDVVDIPRMAVNKLLNLAIGAQASSPDPSILGGQRVYGADVMRRFGITNRAGQLAGGFLWDVLTDPLTWATGFGGVLRQAGKVSIGKVTRSLLKAPAREIENLAKTKGAGTAIRRMAEMGGLDLTRLEQVKNAAQAAGKAEDYAKIVADIAPKAGEGAIDHLTRLKGIEGQVAELVNSFAPEHAGKLFGEVADAAKLSRQGLRLSNEPLRQLPFIGKYAQKLPGMGKVHQTRELLPPGALGMAPRVAGAVYGGAAGAAAGDMTDHPVLGALAGAAIGAAAGPRIGPWLETASAPIRGQLREWFSHAPQNERQRLWQNWQGIVKKANAITLDPEALPADLLKDVTEVGAAWNRVTGLTVTPEHLKQIVTAVRELKADSPDRMMRVLTAIVGDPGGGVLSAKLLRTSKATAIQAPELFGAMEKPPTHMIVPGDKGFVVLKVAVPEPGAAAEAGPKYFHFGVYETVQDATVAAHGDRNGRAILMTYDDQGRLLSPMAREGRPPAAGAAGAAPGGPGGPPRPIMEQGAARKAPTEPNAAYEVFDHPLYGSSNVQPGAISWDKQTGQAFEDGVATNYVRQSGKYDYAMGTTRRSNWVPEGTRVVAPPEPATGAGAAEAAAVTPAEAVPAQPSAAGQSTARYQKGSLSSAIVAARKLKADHPLYIVPTSEGLKIEHQVPPKWQGHAVVEPDGSVRMVQAPSSELKPFTPEEAKTFGVEQPVAAAPAAQAKQPWEMTRDEVKEILGPKAWSQGDEAGNNFQKMHAVNVEQAVSEGKPVPRAVLEEYKGQPWADAALAKLGERAAVAPVAAAEPAAVAAYKVPPPTPHPAYDVASAYRKQHGYIAYGPGERYKRTRANLQKIEAAKSDPEYQRLLAEAKTEQIAQNKVWNAEHAADNAKEAIQSAKAGTLTYKQVPFVPIAQVPPKLRAAMQEMAGFIQDGTEAKPARAALQKIIDGKGDVGRGVEAQKERILNILASGQNEHWQPGGIISPQREMLAELYQEPIPEWHPPPPPPPVIPPTAPEHLEAVAKRLVPDPAATAPPPPKPPPVSATQPPPPDGWEWKILQAEPHLHPEIDAIISRMQLRGAKLIAGEQATGSPISALDEARLLYVHHEQAKEETLFQAFRRLILRGPKAEGVQKMRKFRELSIAELNLAAGKEIFSEDPLVYEVQRQLAHNRIMGNAGFLREFVETYGTKIPPSGIVPEGMVKLRPTVHKLFEAAREYAFTPEVAEDMYWVERTFDRPGPMLEMFDKALSSMKGLMLMAPAYHVRNLISNMWMSAAADAASLSGMSLGWKGIRAARTGNKAMLNRTVAEDLINALTGKPYTFRELTRATDQMGLTSAGFFGTELAKPVKELLEGNKTVWQRARSMGPQQLMALNRAIGTTVEDTSRLSHVITRMRKGDSLEQAVASARKYLLDYNSLTPFEQHTMRRIWPFYTWARNNFALQLELLFERPEIAALMPKIKGNVEGSLPLGQQMPSALRPDYVRKEAGTQIGGGLRPTYMNLSGLTPLPDLKYLTPGGMMRGAIDLLNPAIKMPAELALNKNLYFDRPIQTYPGETVKFAGMDLPPQVAHVAGIVRPLSEANRMISGVQQGEGPATVAGRAVGLRVFEGNAPREIAKFERRQSETDGFMRAKARTAIANGDPGTAQKIAMLFDQQGRPEQGIKVQIMLAEANNDYQGAADLSLALADLQKQRKAEQGPSVAKLQQLGQQVALAR